MQRDVREVVADGVVAPQARLDPERGVEERIVLLGGAELEPDALEAVESAERGARDVRVVVPEKSAPPGRLT